MEKEIYRFWPDQIAKELITKWKAEKQVIVTGTSMSGEPHIGSANDVIRGDAIRLAVEDLGYKAELIWISDNMDPFRSVPADLPKELVDYLGLPACNIPDFWKCHKSFTEHFEEKFLAQLEAVYVKPKVLLGIEMYKKGMYNDMIKLAMVKRNEIAKILNKYRKQPLPQDWYPVDIICKNCGKIATTKILSYNYKTAEAEYKCNPEMILLHRKNPIKGCGFEGKVSILNGNSKLTWRVEWPARWVFLKATCEPFGKEHAVAGGSWDTGKEIVKVLGRNPPYPVIYEHFLVDGEKMSKSKGNVITVSDMLKYIEPKHLRYWMFQGRLTIAKDIRLSQMVPKLWDEFDRAERIYFGLESTKNERKDKNYKRAYEMATKKPKKSSIYVPYDTLIEIAKILPEKNQLDFVIKKLKEFDYIKKVNVKIEREVEKRLEFVKNWCKDFLKPEVKELKLGKMEKDAIKDLITEIKKESDGEKLQTKIFEIAKKNNIKPADFFKLLYGILLKADRGPRLGPYILEIGKKDVIKKLNDTVNKS